MVRIMRLAATTAAVTAMVVLTLTVVVFAMAQAAVASPADGKLQDDFDLAPRKFQALKMTCVGQEDTTVSVKAAEGRRSSCKSSTPKATRSPRTSGPTRR